MKILNAMLSSGKGGMEQMMERPKVDFRPWLVSSGFGDAVLRDDAPEEIKKAWEEHNKKFAENHDF